MKIDVSLGGDLATTPDHAAALRGRRHRRRLHVSRETATSFFPLVTAASAGLDLYTNVAIAFPRSPMHLAYQGWDLQRASGGRFALGLGTQIKPHIERRYSSTWDRPVGRMVDIVKATKAIWANWADGTPLDHLTDFHRFDLMTPIFVPPPMPFAPPPIWAGALGPQMTRAMARHANGVIIHPFNTGNFLASSTMPVIAGGP